MKKFIFIIVILISCFGYSQKKVLQTKSISENITIDGKIDEEAWKTATVGNNFVMFEPDNGKPIPENKRTEVKVLYDNDAIYIGATLYDDEPSKILKEIAKRDEFGTADTFGVFINGNNDGQQDFQFYVTASDGQADCINTNSSGEDYSWDAVWESKAVITDFGWVVEMRIPYSALRFSSQNKQTWGLNFFREIRRDRKKYTWNFVDNKIGSFTQQAGTLEGIENIKTSTRFFLLPYSSYYVNADAENKTKGTLKGGLDIKYGINDAFTLDMVLIPDFGQTKFDEKILNLGPFEQQFNENRPFFTEGTDLFSKGNLLYSRRIGGNPTLSKNDLNNKLNTDEEITNYPNTVSLINALKISGRTKNGLGIGFLNAVTEKTDAIIRNKTTGETRTEVVEPLANFNVLVLDQRFRQTSSIAFVNTNVIRNGDFRDANVTALVWDLNTKKSTYGLQGNFKYSHVRDTEIQNGIYSNLEFNKTSGKYRFGIGNEIYSNNYDNNDLGINNENNYYDFYGNASYRILNPTKRFNNFSLRSNFFSEFRKNTDKVKGGGINLELNITTLKNNALGMGVFVDPFETYDYYDPRVENRFSINPRKCGTWFYISTNYNNKFAFDINPGFSQTTEKYRNSYHIDLSPRYRFNDKLLLIYNFQFNRNNNNKGYFYNDDYDNNPSTPNDIIYSRRNVITYTNTIYGKYSLNSKMTFNLSVRHYWSFSENKNFFLLNPNGRLTDYNGIIPVVNKNKNFDSWNFDLSYNWWFAPGSQIAILYRNNSSLNNAIIDKNFGKNVTNLLNNDALSHTFSISIKYFIDYNQAKHWF
jgi:Domain of unknown function (DUF5916)/Carbohydrate family 9 binding domain-like